VLPRAFAYGEQPRRLDPAKRSLIGLMGRLSSWRIDAISTTKFAALVPLLAAAMWCGLLVVSVLPGAAAEIAR
jgi:hypothetical protein